MRRAALLLFLVSALLLTVGFTSGKQSNAHKAEEKANFIPKLEYLYSKPTVEPTAEYYPSVDLWRVTLIEETSGTPVARFIMDDDSQKVSRVKIYPDATKISYPTLSEDDAIKLAKTSGKVRDELAKHGPYSTGAEYSDGEWTVHFYVKEGGLVGGKPAGGGEKEIARVGVDDDTWELSYVYVGDQVGWLMARGVYGAYGKQANYWYVWGPLALAFALAFLRYDKLFCMRNLDVVALLGFLVSHGFFRAGVVFEAVVLWYPPLIYLLLRTLLMGFGIGERVEKTSFLPTPILLVLAALSAGLVLGLNLDARVIDVGYAGVVGADRIIDGILPYGNFPPDVGTGDTYGPLNYILYVPFVMIFGFSGNWDYLPAAHALTNAAFIGGAIALFFTGWKLSGLRVAAALVLAWTVFPYTLYTTNNNTNDIIVAAIGAAGLALAASPIGRGASVAAGFAVKLFPLLLGPLWLLHDGWRRRPITDFVLGGVAVIFMSFWVLVLDGHPFEAAKLFFEKTIVFQHDRVSPWTIFTQVPALAFLKTPLTVAVAVLAVVVAFVPRGRTVRRLAAFSAALIIAFQLTTNYWFYPYITWFEPFVFLALLPATNQKTPLDGSCRPARTTESAGAGDSELSLD